MKEEEVRPKAIFDEYLRLCEIDTQTFFLDVKQDKCNCPGCGAVGEFAFEKSHFSYESCSTCHTLFVSPRPVETAFIRYYSEAPSVEYWATTFFKSTAEATKDKLWVPKVKMLLDIHERNGATGYQVVDIGGGYGIFAEEMERLTGTRVTVIEPGPRLADICRIKGLNVVEKFLQNVTENDLAAGEKAFVSFELFEHLHNPRAFLESLHGLMQQGEIFTFTTLSSMGVDIQVLWEHSKSVQPPHHLNFFNPISVRMLLERIGFDVLEISTPGTLDVDIIANSQELISDRFWRSFITTATESSRADWQKHLSKTGYSSHMMVSCQK